MILFNSLCVYIFAFSFSPKFDEYEYEGVVFNISIDYGKTFNNEVRIINLELLNELMILSRPITVIYGHSLTFSPDKFIFDLYFFGELMFYPFGKIFCLSLGLGQGYSMFALLNHFPYLLNVKMNIDIPIYTFHNLATGMGVQHNLIIGMGVQHRNAVKLFGYIKSDSFYGIYNSYFFEIGYRAIIKSPPGTRPTH